MKVGTLTIGQSPRVDIIPEIREVLGPDVEIVEKGALDGLDLQDVKELYPEPTDYILVTRMRDGKEVKVAERHIIERMKRCISDFEEEAAVDLIILLCTGEFPNIESQKIVLRPDRVMLRTIQGIMDRGKMGVVVPSPDQILQLRERWEKTNLQVLVEAISPYTATDEELKGAAGRIKALDVDLVVLDCLGFGKKTRAIFREITRKPVLLPRTVVATIAREMLGM
jgi:protein AroM